MNLIVSFALFFFGLSVQAAIDPARRVEVGYSRGTYSDSNTTVENSVRLRTPVLEGLDFGLDFGQREVFGEKGMLLAPFAVFSVNDRVVVQGGGVVSDSSPVYPVSSLFAQAGYKWRENRDLITYVGAGHTNYLKSAYEQFVVAEVVWYSPWGLILQGGNRFVKGEPLGDTYGRLYAVATYEMLKASVSLRHDRGREAYEIVGVDRYRFNFESSSTSLNIRFALPENLVGLAGYEDYQSEGLNRQTWSLGLGVGF